MKQVNNGRECDISMTGPRNGKIPEMIKFNTVGFNELYKRPGSLFTKKTKC